MTTELPGLDGSECSALRNQDDSPESSHTATVPCHVIPSATGGENICYFFLNLLTNCTSHDTLQFNPDVAKCMFVSLLVAA